MEKLSLLSFQSDEGHFIGEKFDDLQHSMVIYVQFLPFENLWYITKITQDRLLYSTDS